MPALTSSPPWSPETKQACIERGCHRSAVEHAGFLREEMSEFIDNRFWAVLPYRAVAHLPNLQLSPAAVKEERERKPRLLCDHSWYPVNDTTLPHAPPEAMQFGGALQRILELVRHADPQYGPVHLSKHDIKDGYYRLFLKPEDCLRLAIILPTYDDEEQLVAIPMACTMGWVESPPTFCTMSETVADETNRRTVENQEIAEPHRLEAAAAAGDDPRERVLSPEPAPEPSRPPPEPCKGATIATRQPQNRATRDCESQPERANPSRSRGHDSEERAPPSNRVAPRPVTHTDVYVDDFMQLAQGTPERLRSVRRHLFHVIDAILAQPLEGESRNEAVSLKKMAKGDGSWHTRKLFLGWIVDSARQTLELPEHRKQEVEAIFQGLRGARRASAKNWRKLLGKLRFVALAIPGALALLSALQWAMNQAGENRVRITLPVRHSLDAFERLCADLGRRPTHLAEIVPQEPTLLGATDACKTGMGGIYFDADGKGHVWRHPFPVDVQADVVSSDNPTGRITNSDLEQAALLAQLDVMSCSHASRYATLHNLTDNTAALSRARKGAVSKPGAAARLCQVASDHQRLHRYCHQAGFIPGLSNVAADDASRLQHLSPLSFDAHFAQRYPLPTPWRTQALRPEMASLLTSALRCSSPTQPWSPKPAQPVTPCSKTGPVSALHTDAPLPSAISHCRKPSWRTSSCTPCGDAAKLPPRPASLCELAQWRTHYWPWARGSPHWVSRIPAKRLQDPSGTIPYSLLSCEPCPTKTTPKHARTRSTSPSSAECPTSSTSATACMDPRTAARATYA